MALQTVYKDMGEIYARLLDHRPVLQAEINYTLREFEEKRNNREQARLQRSLESLTEMKDHLVPTSMEGMEESVPELLDSLQEVNVLCNKLLEREGDNPGCDWLKEQRGERVKDWAQFMDNMCKKSAAVDEEYNDEVLRVTQYYKELELKLKISPTNQS